MFFYIDLRVDKLFTIHSFIFMLNTPYLKCHIWILS